jgi:hypothetical protein
MNLNIISQALTGGSFGVADPLRDREYKRARKEISEGIQGAGIGAALLVAAGLGYSLAPAHTVIYLIALVLALIGLVKLFRSVARILDAKVGAKLMSPAMQRATGGLAASTPSPVIPGVVRASQRLPGSPQKPAAPGPTRPVSVENNSSTPTSLPPPPIGDQPPARPFTGRVNREHSSPLRKPDKDDDFMSKLRN